MYAFFLEVKHLEKQAAGLRKDILNYKQKRRRGAPPLLTSSKSVEASLNIEAELGIRGLLPAIYRYCILKNFQNGLCQSFREL